MACSRIATERKLLNPNPGESLVIKDDCQSAIKALMRRGYPAIELVAKHIGSSVRTLQRRLRESGVTYSALVDQVRHELACRKLETTRLHVRDVATDLGFKDHSSFSRAFVRWTGMSPRAYRKSLSQTALPAKGGPRASGS